VVADEMRPDTALETESDLSMALMVLLDDLRPLERTVYVLREAFDRPYAEIARSVDRTEAHCRKLAQRARTRIDAEDEQLDAPPPAHAELLDQFVQALETRDPETLAKILAEDVTHITDGGEVKEAAKRPIEGIERVERFLFSISKKTADALRGRPVRVNGRPGLLVLQDDRVHSVWCLRVLDGQIQAIYCVRNPEKLQHLRQPPLGRPEEAR
jgi:RNA polymerase sigma-70 factor (ECF subfamily)